MENHMSDGTKWDDAELMDTKDIFIKMMDFIRNYDPGTEEYTRRIRFTTHEALNDLVQAHDMFSRSLSYESTKKINEILFVHFSMR